MNNKLNKESFTLIELIVVILIVSVIVSLALIKMFKTVELSKAAEAIETLRAIRSSVERCSLHSGGDVTDCRLNFPNEGDNTLDLDNPDNMPGARFKYKAIPAAEPGAYSIVAMRNTYDNGSGDPNDWIALQSSPGLNTVKLTGNGIYSSIDR